MSRVKSIVDTDNVKLLRCKECTQFLRVYPQGTTLIKVACPNSKCKHINDIKIVTSKSSQEDIKTRLL